MGSYGNLDLTWGIHIMEHLPNKVIEQRTCKKCGGMSAYTWYTKRGRYNVICMKCGKTWDINSEVEAHDKRRKKE
jgi:Fe2+ or Zn2+ uptake regulation protein